MTETPLIFVTGNRNKVLEAKAILGSTATLEVLDINIPEIQGTVEEITREKCRAAAETVRYILYHDFHQLPTCPA
jgi:inosine triphosphate pyrophosphatase